MKNLVSISRDSNGDFMRISEFLKRILTIVQECNENAQRNPKTALSWNLKGIALSNEGEYDEAIKPTFRTLDH